MKKILVLGGLMLCAPMLANAGTCAAPTPLAGNSTVDDTTCGGEIGINMGGTIYGHPSNVFSVHIDHAADPLGHIAITGTNREMSLTSSCTTAPIAAGAPGLDIDAQPVANGDYLLVVSTDPSIPPTNPPTCGTFELVTGPLPVALQSFTVE
jgi:hypothetical protein